MHEVGGNCLKYLKEGGTKKRGGEIKILKRGQAGSRGGCLEKRGDWNPLMNHDNTTYNLLKCWMYIFSWGYSPDSLSDILCLARDSLLKHLYFLQFLGRLLASLLCMCKNSIKTP